MMSTPRTGEESGGTDRGGVRTDQPLALVIDLAAGFREADVDFCHWKSNAAIDLSEAGVNDLDLLVAEQHVETARRVLDDLGFVAASVPSGRRVPGLTDYFGLDGPSGRLVQVQLHEWLVVGDDMTKNFHLPVETAYLASSRTDRVLPVPAPEFEYVVFVLRMAVKHCPVDAVAMGKGRLSVSEREELEFLDGVMAPERLEQVLADVFPWLDTKTLDLLRLGLDRDASIATRARVGRRVTRLLSPFRRHNGSMDLLLRITRRITRRVTARRPPGTGVGFKTLTTGGGVIAFLGGDGAGKSTAVKAVFGTLSAQFRVALIHMGKPPRSLTSRIANKLVRLLNLRVSGETYPAWSDFDDGYPGPGLPLMNLMLARDRLRQARSARSMAHDGWIVLSDRYPVPELKTMDAPRNARIAARFPSVFTRQMARIEGRYYDALPEPDLRLVFRLSPEVAVSRRPEQDDEFVSVRAGEVAEIEWEAAVVLSAEDTPDLVHGEATRTTWEFLTRERRARQT